jgi:hypothetical protein
MAARLSWRLRTEQAVHQAAQAIGLLDDDAGVLLQRPVGELPLQELRRTAYPAEGILDLVGHPAYHGEWSAGR